MNHDDTSFGAPDPLTTEEAAELANALPPTLEDAYAEGRKDEREAIEQDLCTIIGGPYYMDPPDGGDVPLMEQLRRMAEDARVTREERYRVARANDAWIRSEG